MDWLIETQSQRGPPRRCQLLKLSYSILNGDDHLKAEVFGDDVECHANCCAD